MQLSRYIHGFLAVLASCALLSCAFDDHVPADTPAGAESVVTFYPSLDDALSTKAMGDATRINQLWVAVYEKTGDTREHRFTLDYAWNVAQLGLQLTLIEGRTYDILFWAQCEENKAYTLNNAGQIQVNYTDYLAGGFAKMEALDAFYATSSVIVGSTAVENKGAITLTRPLAQVNFADNATQPVQGSHCTKLTFHAYPTALDPFSKTVAATTADLTFIFEDYPTETLSAQGATYYYVATNYFFAPYTISKATLDFQDNQGNSLKKIVVDDLLMEPNKKTNVLGSIVGTPTTWSVWDGLVELETVPALDQDRYIIDEAADIAWLSENASTLKTGKTFLLTIDIDMAAKLGLSSIQLPSGSTLDGQGHTIKGVRLSGALFGNATELVMKDLTLEDVQVSSPDSHAGVLVNTLKGSGSFSGIHIKNSSVESLTGAAGGVVGYVVRKSANDRSEALEVVFDDCHVEGSSVTGNLAQGHFVGLLRGYDAGEFLRFNDNCTYVASASASLATGPVSPYCEGNEGAWLAENDYRGFNGWLGNEECYRGQVFYGTKRFIPRWDGTTKITPLTEGTTKLIYSAFDLANCAGTNPGAIKFMENVDLGSQLFNPLTNLSKLIGEDKTIYNMKVETTFNTNSWDGGGFIRRCSAATIENITFKNADVKVTHVDGSDGDAYASIVCGTAEGTNTITNVKVIGGKLYGCNKMGGIAGYITGTFTATNCLVDGLSIENYDSGGKDKLGFKANGEVGGAFGFIAANATISGCYVKNSTLNCRGVNNGRALVFFKYAGRHVNEFIGDIRTTAGQTIRITLDEKNFTGNTYKNRKDQYAECKYIGHCYYTSINAGIAKIEDTKGTVYVNDKSITVAKNY